MKKIKLYLDTSVISYLDQKAITALESNKELLIYTPQSITIGEDND